MVSTPRWSLSARALASCGPCGRRWRLVVGPIHIPGRLTRTGRPDRKAAFLVVEHPERSRATPLKPLVDLALAERRLDHHLRRLDAEHVTKTELPRNEVGDLDELVAIRTLLQELALQNQGS